jgi:hypothetical protein
MFTRKVQITGETRMPTLRLYPGFTGYRCAGARTPTDSVPAGSDSPTPKGTAISVLGLDLGHPTIRAADEWLAGLPPLPGLVACTHQVRGGHPRVVVTVAAPGPIDLTTLPLKPEGAPPAPDDGAALTAAGEHAGRHSGRAVIFPGAPALVGTVTVADVLATSAIDRVLVLGGAIPEPDAPLDTRNFVRPQWKNGELTLLTTWVGGRLVPFEAPAPAALTR